MYMARGRRGHVLFSSVDYFFFLVLSIKMEELCGDRTRLIEAPNAPVSGQADLTAVCALEEHGVMKLRLVEWGKQKG